MTGSQIKVVAAKKELWFGTLCTEARGQLGTRVSNSHIVVKRYRSSIQADSREENSHVLGYWSYGGGGDYGQF